MASAGFRSSNFRSRFLALSLLVFTTAGQVALMSGSFTPANAQGSNTLVELNNAGVNALNSGNFQLAIQKLEEALKIDPNYGRARENLAIAYNNYGLKLQGDPKQAIKMFHKALYLNRANPTTIQNVEGIIRMMHMDPRDFEDRVALGDQARLGADFVGAIIEYSEAVKIKDDPKIRIKLGDVYRVRDEIDKAVAEYQAAARVGDTAEIEVKLGQAYQAKKDLPNAIQAYGKAIALKPDDSDVLDALQAGWEEALKENPLAPENHIGLGQALEYRGDFSGAKGEYDQAKRLAKGGQTAAIADKLLAGLPAKEKAKKVDSFVAQGVDLQGKKLFDQALDAYQRGLGLDPQNDAIWVNIGTLYQARGKDGDLEKALEAYNQALKINGGNKDAQQGVKTASAQLQDKKIGDAEKAGGDLFKAGKYDEAIAKYQELIKADPKNAAYHFNLGACFQAKKLIDQAMTEYRLAINLDPKNKDYPKALEGALDAKVDPILKQAIEKHQAKDYGSAIALYQQALQIKGDNAEVWFNLASAQYAQQDYASAKVSYQKAFDLDSKKWVDNLYLMGAIEEHFGRGTNAQALYQKYLVSAPSGRYVAQAKDRLAALNKDITATIKIKSEAELAQIKDAADSYQQAVQLQQAGKLDEALPLYQKAIQLQPREAGFVYGLGTLYQLKKDFDNAITQYKLASSLDPKNKDYLKAIDSATELKAAPLAEAAVAKQTSGDFPAAIDLYKKALEVLPKNSEIWRNLGSAYQASDQFSQARDAYLQAYNLDNKAEINCLYFMAVLDETLNQGPLALQKYQKYMLGAPTGTYAQQAKDRIAVLSKNPSNVAKLQTTGERKNAEAAQTAYQEGMKLQQDQKYDEAIAKYDAASQMFPNEPAYAFAKATAYQAKQDSVNAAVWYQKAIDLGSPDQKKQWQPYLTAMKESQAGPSFEDGAKKYQAGDYQGAIDAYQKGMGITPNYARGWTMIGAAYQQLENWDQARNYYQKGLDADKKGEVENLYYMGILDENSGKGALALQDYQQYILTNPKAANAADAQARIARLKVNPNNVVKIVTQQEVKVAGERQAAYDEAIKLQTDGKYDEAIASYEKAIASKPDPAYMFGEGTAYQAKYGAKNDPTQQADLDKAIELYKRAIASVDPKSSTASQAIAQFKSALESANALKAAPLVDAGYKKQTTELEPAGSQKYDTAGAIADYEAALKFIPNDAGVHFSLGTAYQVVGNLPKALQEYQTTIRLDPKNVEAVYWLATVYEAMKKPADALREYNKYIKMPGPPAPQNVAAAKERIKLLTPQAVGKR